MEIMQLSIDAFIGNEENKKKTLKDIWKSYCARSKKYTVEEIREYLSSSNKVNKKENVYISKSREELKEELENFISNDINDLQEEASLCMELCEEEDNFHLVSYWIDGTYSNIKEYLNQSYTEELGDIILEMYPNDLLVLENKIRQIYGEVSRNQIIIEALATILLQKYQYYHEWFCIYGTEEEDMIDFNKYSIVDALNDRDNFPIIKREDIVAAMYGINTTVQPSDLYNVFAYYADELKFKKDKNLLDENKEELTFTPDPFLVAGVEARWKNYVDLVNKSKSKCCIDYVLKFNQLSMIKDYDTRNIAIILSAVDDYMNRFSKAPTSLPILKDMVKAEYKDNNYEIQYSIRGVRNKNTAWDNILIEKYDIPVTPEEYQELIFNIALDFKRELNGIQKKANGLEAAYYGKYPNKDSATHGLKFIKDLNVHYKDKRGIPQKKLAKTNFNLSLAEKQSTYLIKKILRHTRNNPILSTSFGMDSTITQHLLKRVAKHSYNLVHNNSLIEYPDLAKFRRRMIKEWNLEDRITITKPIKTYWEIKEKYGFNFNRKGDRRNGASVSEICCGYIKHKPMYNLLDKLTEEGNPMEVNFTGLRASEARQRSQQVLRDNVIYYAKSWGSLKVSPIAFYTDEMIWEYVRKHDVPYCDVYDKVLYYEDVYDNVTEEEYGKVLYRPRVGCWACSVTVTSSHYIFWLRKFLPKQFRYLMVNQEMAKDLFLLVAKKEGLINDSYNSSREKNKDTNQLSLFDTFEDDKEEIQDPFKNLSSEDILNNYSLESMQHMIMRKPCKVIS